MATTNIELEIESIANVADANANFILSAQKSVASAIPKELMKWAASETDPDTHGGDDSSTAITLPVMTDNILSVRRGSYFASEVSSFESPFLDDSNSLRKATTTFPKYWRAVDESSDAYVINVKPDPTSSVKAYARYVNFANIDDDCDLKASVIYKAVSNELMAKSSSSATSASISLQTAPTAPSAPSFTYTNASVGDMTIPSTSIADMVALDASAPTYTAPTLNPDYTDANTWINTEEDSEMSAARVQVIQSQIAKYNSEVQNALNVFNKENTVYQEDIQRKIQNLNKEVQEHIKNIDAELSARSSNLSKDQQIALQNAIQNFQQDVQEYSAKLEKYSAEIASYQAQVSEQVQKGTIGLQQSQSFLAEADKYYNWYLLEIKQYIESNSTMIDRMAAVSAATRGGR
jgi:hypothetical protein